MPDRLGWAGGLLGRSRGRHRGGAGNRRLRRRGGRAGWLIWPLIPYSYNTVNDLGRSAPSPPDGDHWLGTDDTARDVLARVIYGFRLSVTFALLVTFLTSVIGIFMGAIQGYYGGWVDLSSSASSRSGTRRRSFT
jgi:ABC-type microcin C transport system permease subunit YejE